MKRSVKLCSGNPTPLRSCFAIIVAFVPKVEKVGENTRNSLFRPFAAAEETYVLLACCVLLPTTQFRFLEAAEICHVNQRRKKLALAKEQMEHHAKSVFSRVILLQNVKT
jgi:hypothetical protein